MNELKVLLSPLVWSIKNDVVTMNRAWYRKAGIYLVSGALFIFLVTKLLDTGMDRLQNLSPEVFQFLLIRGYSLIFIIIFFVQIINGVVLSLNTFYQSGELEALFISPVSRTSLFFSRLIETYLNASWMLLIFGFPLLASLGHQFDAGPLFYLYSLALFAVFSIIPVNAGIGVTMVLSGIFYIKKLKEFIVSAGITTLVIIITVLRVFSPERFVNPESFANLTLFLSELRTPSFILLPNRWLSESLFRFLQKDYAGTLIFISLLFLTSYITVFFLLSIFQKYHFRGWCLLQSGGIALKERRRDPRRVSRRVKAAVSGVVRRLSFFIHPRSRMLLMKDLLYQVHDTKNLHQLLILFSLIIVYLFSITALPINWEGYGLRLRYVIAFFNLGLVLIIIASLCSRVIYPAIISDAQSLWIVKTSPVTPGRYVWTKFSFFFLPVFLFGEFLTIFSSLFIEIRWELFALIILTTALLCFSLVSMAIAFGLSDLTGKPDAGGEDEAVRSSAIHMVVSVFLILFTLALEVVPIFLYYVEESAGIELAQKAWLIIGAVAFVILLVNILVSALSMRMSARRFSGLQLH